MQKFVVVELPVLGEYLPGTEIACWVVGTFLIESEREALVQAELSEGAPNDGCRYVAFRE